jgi:hypothetical protein
VAEDERGTTGLVSVSKKHSHFSLAEKHFPGNIFRFSEGRGKITTKNYSLESEARHYRRVIKQEAVYVKN